MTSSGMRMVESDVPCPGCGGRVCNVCMLNGSCQHCRQPLDRGTMAAFDAWWQEHGEASDSPSSG